MTAWKALLLIIVLSALIAAAFALPVHEWLGAGITWIGRYPRTAWAIYVGAYIVAAVLVVPGSVLTLAAGFIFGLPLGVVLASAGSVLGAAAAFLVGRFLARDWVAARITDLPRFRALDAATHHDGFMIVFLARLSPLFPFNLLNYGLGLTAVRFRDFVLASWIGMLPATALYVYIGSLANNVTALAGGEVEGGWATRALLVGGFIATLLLTIVITRRATGTLRKRLKHEESATGAAAPNGLE